MFDFVARHKRLLFVFVALLIVPPFALFGIDFYTRGGVRAGEVAAVDGQKIFEQEFSEAVRQQQDRMRDMLGKNYDPSMFDSPAIRAELLEGMISQRLLMQHAVRSRLNVSDDMLVETITNIPAFQVDGKFSRQRYEMALRNERMSPETFDAALRRDLLVQQLSGAVADSGMESKVAARRVAQLRAQQREVAELRVRADPSRVKVAPEAVRAYYDANPSRFMVPEEVRVEYVALSVEALIAAEKVGGDEIKAYYEANISKYGDPEQRRASHILVSIKSGAVESDKARVRERAEQLLVQVRKSPESFADIARKNSEDPGSAAQGGDLGFFARGMMVRPFEDAVFRLKPNQISDLVESDFGFHIIRLTGIRAGKMKSIEQVRPEIELELKKQRAGRRFAEAADSFSNLVYEQADSLAPAAERFKLAIQRAQRVTRQSADVPVLSHPKLLAALFADESIKNRRNTEAVETQPGMLVSARVIDHKPATRRPFDEVRADLGKQLAQQEALASARKEGTERLEALRSGKDSAARFSAPRVVSRDQPKDMSGEALAQAFRADMSKLPAYTGVESKDGYTILRVSRVIDVSPDEARERSVQGELGRSNGQEEFKAFLGGLRSDARVEINRSILERKAN